MIRVFLDRIYLFSGYLAGLFLIAIFVLMMLLSAGRPLGINIPAGDDFISWCMAATAFLGLAHTFKHGEMIRVGLLIDRLNDNVRHYVEIAALLVGVGFIGFFAWHASVMTWQSWKFSDISQGVIAVPLWIPQLGYSGGLVIFSSLLWMNWSMSCAASRRATNCRSRRAPRRSSNAPCRAGSDMELLSIAAILLGFLALLLGAGVWIGVALMATGWAGMQFAGGAIPAGSVLATTVWGNSASWSLAALPLFIWMGEILFRTRLSEEMFRGFAPWLNWLPGRLMHVNVLACGVFGSVSGSSAATCATVAKIALPELKKRGYDENLSLGSLAGAGTLGILIPPSITMVVYAVQANVSIIQVFLAGFLPGLLVMTLYSGYIAIWSLANPTRTPPADPPMSLRRRIAELLNLIPCLLLIVFVFLSLLMGWATATECAAWGVLGSLAIAWWQGALTWESFWASVMGATRVNCMILLILAGASYMGTSMAYTGIPLALANWVNGLQLSPYALIAALTVMYIVLGTALDGISMIVLTTAIVIPMVKQAGFDLIWFGIFLVLVVEMAEVSPPVGFNLFVLQTMSGKDSNTVAKAALPFFFLLVLAVAIITVFPAIVMLLPRIAFPG